MRRQVPVETNPAQRLRPAFVVNAELVALAAAIGLIAAITVYAPHLQLP